MALIKKEANTIVIECRDAFERDAIMETLKKSLCRFEELYD